MLNSKLFDVDLKDKTFFQEVSTLIANGFSNWERLYDDAADVGINLVSKKTGKTVKFYLVEEQRGLEGEVNSWLLKPTTDAIRKFPRLEGWQIVVFND